MIKVKKIKHLIQQNIKGKSAKAVLSIFSFRVFAYLITIVYGVILARWLGPDKRGMIAVLFVIPITISAFIPLGLPISNVYYLGKGRDKETLLINSLYFTFLTSSISILLVYFFMPILKKTYFSGLESISLAYLTVAIIPLLLLRNFLGSFLRGLMMFNGLSYSSPIQESIKLLILVLGFFFFTPDIKIVILAVTLSILVNNLYIFLLLRKKVSVVLGKANFVQFKENVNYGLREYLGNLLGTLNNRIDLLILASFMDYKSLGIYAVAMGISSMFQFFPNSLGTVLLPKLTTTMDKNRNAIIRKSIWANLLILSFPYFFFAVTGKWLIVFIYGDKFADAYFLSLFLILGMILLSICLIINKYFSAIGKPEIKSKIRALNIPIKIVAMLFLINKFGIEGAAYSFVVSTSTLLLFTVIFYIRVKKRRMPNTGALPAAPRPLLPLRLPPE